MTAEIIRWPRFPVVRTDGGAAAAGYTEGAGDCVPRAIAIATGLPYGDVLAELRTRAKVKAKTARRRKHGHPRSGVHRNVYEPFLFELGWVWLPLMAVGQGTKVHLIPDEVPTEGIYIVKVSKHLTVVRDGRIHDTADPQRDGTRCVYGWYEPGANAQVAA